LIGRFANAVHEAVFYVPLAKAVYLASTTKAVFYPRQGRLAKAETGGHGIPKSRRKDTPRCPIAASFLPASCPPFGLR